ncbi:hypothetical protein AAMO2058_001613300 [Amorphochlora amoebiformis]
MADTEPRPEETSDAQGGQIENNNKEDIREKDKQDSDRKGDTTKTAGKKRKKSSKKKGDKKKKKKRKKPTSALPSADELLNIEEVPDFLAQSIEQEKSALIEAKIEADLKRKNKIKREVEVMEEAAMAKAEDDLELHYARSVKKEQRRRLKAARDRGPPKPNVMNRVSIHKWH